jgi:hypothetical protein
LVIWKNRLRFSAGSFHGGIVVSELATLPALPSWQRWFLRADPWSAVIFAVLVLLWECWEFSSPLVAMGDLGIVAFLGTVFFLQLARLAQYPVRWVFEGYCNAYPNPYLSRRPFWPWFVLLTFGAIVLAATRLPLTLGFLVSAPAMNRIADDALADPIIVAELGGQRAGIYQIEEVEVVGQTVVLYLHRTPWGSYSFVRAGGATENRYRGSLPGLPVSPIDHVDPNKEYFPAMADRVWGDWFVRYAYDDR